MRTYGALIRLARFRVEGLTNQLAALEAARGDLMRQIEQLAASVPEDHVAASASKEGFVAYGSYARAVIARKRNLRGSIEEVAAQAAELRSQLDGAVAELAKYEAMEERRAAAERGSADPTQGRRAAG